MSNIIEKQNYICPSRYISGRIIEYDIKAANINCLRSANIITEEDYIYLNNLPKMQREVEIGIREKADPSLYTVIQTKIKEAKIFLAESNNINDNNIVRIANDAVYINSPFNLNNLEYDKYIRFVPKSESNVCLIIDKVLIFIKFLEDGNINVDVKGIKEEHVSHSMNYLLSEIVSCCVIKERSGIRDAINYLALFIEQYLKLELPCDFYREFDSGRYRVKNFEINCFGLSVDTITDNDKQFIDINYNYGILRELWSIFIELYNMQQ